MKKFSEISTVGQLAIMLGVAALIVGAGEYLWLNTLRTANDELKGQVAVIKAENDKFRPFEAKLKTIKADNERLEAQLNNLRSIVPEEKEADAFIRMVQEAGVQAGVNVRSFTARPNAAKEFYMEMPFDLAVDGNFYTVLQFFDRLSRLSRIINVTNLAMGPSSGGVRGYGRRYTLTANETVLASFTATTFYSRETPAAAKR